MPESFARDVVRAADAYRTKGNEAAAACAGTLLATAAGQRAFTEPELGPHGDRQGYYVQTWLLAGLALAYLKVEGSTADTPEQHAAIADWLSKLAERVRKMHNELSARKTGDSANNHHYWAGLAAAAGGIPANRRDLFDWGLNAGRVGLKQVMPDGTLPREMARASMASHYHLFAVAPLVLLAELGEANGVDLYAEDGGALERLAHRALLGLVNPSFYVERTGVAQAPQDPEGASTVGWVPPFQRRYPDPLVADLLAKAHNLSYWMYGGIAPP